MRIFWGGSDFFFFLEGRACLGWGFFGGEGLFGLSFFFKGKLSCSLLDDPVRVVIVLSGLFLYDYKDEKHISLFLTSLFRFISHTPEKKQKQCGATKASFLYISLPLTSAPSNSLCDIASASSGLEQQD